MSSRTYKSGFAKRKEREKRDADTEKGQTRMDLFVKRPRGSDLQDASSEASTSNADPVQEQEDESNRAPLSPNADAMEEQYEDGVDIASPSCESGFLFHFNYFIENVYCICQHISMFFAFSI